MLHLPGRETELTTQLKTVRKELSDILDPTKVLSESDVAAMKQGRLTGDRLFDAALCLAWGTQQKYHYNRGPDYPSWINVAHAIYNRLREAQQALSSWEGGFLLYDDSSSVQADSHPKIFIGRVENPALRIEFQQGKDAPKVPSVSIGDYTYIDALHFLGRKTDYYSRIVLDDIIRGEVYLSVTYPSGFDKPRMHFSRIINRRCNGKTFDITSHFVPENWWNPEGWCEWRVSSWRGETVAATGMHRLYLGEEEIRTNFLEKLSSFPIVERPTTRRLFKAAEAEIELLLAQPEYLDA
ncbi:MAG TPA: hypothetical protein VI612_05735 [Candidatus Nanoarchaeia archaeon]|nr:hypothetical protein [Candidatus Nanoarchaeia archaeon]